LYFAQIWLDLAGFTIRVEDVLSLFMLVGLFLPVAMTARLRYYRSPINAPLLLWNSALLFGLLVTLTSPFDSVTKKDAMINGIRLVLALNLFFVVYHHPAPARDKVQAILGTTIRFSFVTTAVALLQIGYWDGWLPIRLPAILTELKEGANAALGREIFALYVGNTGTHTWSAMLAMQALAVWVTAWNTRRTLSRWARLGYFALLYLILIRISVRNGILGLFFSIFGLTLLNAWRSGYPWKRILKSALAIVLAILAIYALFRLAPDSYFMERIRQAIPQWQGYSLIIDRASNIYGRIDYAATALAIFQSQPVIGGGFWSYKTLSGILGPESAVHAHNSFFQTMAEMGSVGAIVLVWLIWRIGAYLQRSGRNLGDKKRRIVIWQTTVGSLLLIVFTAFFSNSLSEPTEVGFRMVLLGALISLEREEGW
jgi:hypothetical protein